jgi:hypothetical protein
MTEYERRRRLIAQREYNRRRPVQNFNVWYNDSFLTDLIFLDLVMNELGPEENYTEESPSYQEETTSEQESEPDKYDYSSDSSSDFGSDGDSGGGDFSD